MNQTLTATVLVAIAIILVEVQRLGVGKDLFIGAIRSFIQLMAIGYVLQYIFNLEKLPYQILLLLIMVVIASFTAKGRAKELPGAFFISFIAILTGATFTLGLMLLLRLISTEPNYLIPLGGMVIGNTMNGTALVLMRVSEGMKDKRNEIEALLALGASPRYASSRVLKSSVRAALLPFINTMKIVGLIQLPGAMTGMMIAGASPIEATRVQIMVMYMISASVTTGTMIASLLSYRAFFNRAHQLIELP